MFASLKQYLPDHKPTRTELGWILLPITMAVCLLVFDRYVVQPRFLERFSADLLAAGYTRNEVHFASQIWFSTGCFLVLAIVPTLYLKLFPLAHTWGLRHGKIRRNLPVYALLFMLMVPLLWIAAGNADFATYYPLYDPPTWQLWVAFEAVYLAQFFCVEYFFRGPLLFRCEARFGQAAIGMMMVPYALIHIYKPVPEALGSIVAGLLLGYLALQARSIWPGILLHCSVALTMDVFALLRTDRLAALTGL